MGDIRDRLLVERAMKIEELAARVAALEDLHRRNVEQAPHGNVGTGEGQPKSKRRWKVSDKRIERLRELSQAVVDGRIREFDMRIPAEKDRDADYVLDWAAEEIECLNARVAELEAGVRHAAAVIADADYVLDWAAEEIECLNARVAELEKSALLMFNAIALAPVDCMGIVPERYDCPAYPRRDEVLHNAAPPIRHLLEAKDDE